MEIPNNGRAVQCHILRIYIPQNYQFRIWEIKTHQISGTFEFLQKVGFDLIKYTNWFWNSKCGWTCSGSNYRTRSICWSSLIHCVLPLLDTHMQSKLLLLASTLGNIGGGRFCPDQPGREGGQTRLPLHSRGAFFHEGQTIVRYICSFSLAGFWLTVHIILCFLPSYLLSFWTLLSFSFTQKLEKAKMNYSPGYSWKNSLKLTKKSPT